MLPIEETNTSAALRLLAIPTILSDIFTLVLSGDGLLPLIGLHDGHGALLRCALVNHFWHTEAMRVLWRKLPYSLRQSLGRFLINIRPERRQWYANWIEHCQELGYEKPDSPELIAIKNLYFPKLRKIKLLRGGDYVPVFRTPALDEVHVVQHGRHVATDVFLNGLAASIKNEAKIIIVNMLFRYAGWDELECYRVRFPNSQVELRQ